MAQKLVKRRIKNIYESFSDALGKYPLRMNWIAEKPKEKSREFNKR